MSDVTYTLGGHAPQGFREAVDEAAKVLGLPGPRSGMAEFRPKVRRASTEFHLLGDDLSLTGRLALPRDPPWLEMPSLDGRTEILLEYGRLVTSK